MTFTTVTLPPATLGVPYEAGLGVTAALSGGAVASGALPPGITLASATDPRLIGTPTATTNPAWTQSSTFQPNVFTFTISGSGTSPTYTITVFGTTGDDESVALGLTPSALAAQRKLN